MLPSFPHGTVGVALFVLRSALAVMLVSVGVEPQALSMHRTLLILSIKSMICLCIGFLTASVVALCAVAALVATLAIPGVHLDRGAIASAVSISVALLAAGSLLRGFSSLRLAQTHPPP